MNDIRFSVVIPCFNEEFAIEETLHDLNGYLEGAGSYEIIVVDDGSTDNTRAILEKTVQGQQNLTVIYHERNQGYGASLKTGIRRANSELIVITDADGTYPNHKIPELVTLAESASMVVGSRTGANVTYSKIRKIPKIFLRWYCSWIAGRDIPDINSGLRVFKKELAEKYFNILPNGFSFTTTITLALLTNYYDVRYVPIDYSARIGQSKIKPISDTLKFIQLIVRTGTYFAPLRVFSPIIGVLGLCFAGSLAYDIFVLDNLTDKTILFLLSGLNVGMFALLADMIDKRTSK